jgi:hypothetical protein
MQRSALAKKQLTMRTLLMFVLAVSAIFSQGTAQAQSLKDSTYHLPKWEVGLDLLPLYYKTSVGSSSVLIRRNYTVSGDRAKAWRMRAELDVRLQRDNDGNTNLTSLDFSPYLALGHEWKHMHKRWNWYWATELGGWYQWSNRSRSTGNGDPNFEAYGRNFSIGGKGIIGAQYSLRKRLAIGVESALAADYSRQYRKNAVDGMPPTGGSHSAFYAGLIPLMAVNLVLGL